LIHFLLKKTLVFPDKHNNIYTGIMTDDLSREVLISKASDLKVIPALNSIVGKEKGKIDREVDKVMEFLRLS